MAELCLGTVQFGMEYGINNVLGQPSWKESFHMLDIAIENGIKVFDTASAYGEAEEILGHYIKERNLEDKIQVISKLSPNLINKDENNIEGIIRQELESSLSRLNLSQLNGYLLHTPEYIYNQQILKALLKFKEENLIQNLGVSIYDMEHGEEAIRTGVVNYIQLPYSIFDQRGIKTGFIKRAKQHGITIFARSAFLQGLFMMAHNKIPDYLNSAIIYLEIFEKLLQKYSISKVEAIIKFVVQEQEIDYFVFGVDTEKQLIEDINLYENKRDISEFIKEAKKEFCGMDKNIILPSLWSNGKKVQAKK